MTDQIRPRLSASVILSRKHDGAGAGFEIFLLKRIDRSGFMSGRYVFPGGGLIESDGPGQKGLMNCAIRELWEEAGVVLARSTEPGAVPDPAGLEEGRRKLQDEGQGLEKVLAWMGLVPDLDLLTPFARWITPKARPKRFDTTFYLALLPEGQSARADEQETSQGVWLTPAQALEQNASGRVGLAPPQVRIVGELAGYGRLEDMFREFAGRDSLEPVQPVLWSEKGRRIIFLPWDRDHGSGSPVSAAEPCPAGECTRLVHDQGRWHPYACQKEPT